MVREWMLWQEDKFLKAAAAVTKKLDDPFQSFTFWNTISYFCPFSFGISATPPSKQFKEGIASKMESLATDWVDNYMKQNGLKLPPPSHEYNRGLQEIQAIVLSAGSMFGTDLVAGQPPPGGAVCGMLVGTLAFQMANEYLAKENARKKY